MWKSEFRGVHCWSAMRALRRSPRVGRRARKSAGVTRGHRTGPGSGPSFRIPLLRPWRVCGDALDLARFAAGLTAASSHFLRGRPRASHAVAAVEAAVAGAAADGQGPAVVAGGGVALEVGELPVPLARGRRRRELAGERRRGRLGVMRPQDGLGVLEVGDGGGAVAVDLDDRRTRASARARRPAAWGRWPRGSRG